MKLLDKSHWLAFIASMVFVGLLIGFGVDWKEKSIETSPTEVTEQTQVIETTSPFISETTILDLFTIPEETVTYPTEETVIIIMPTEPVHDVFYDIEVRGAYGRLSIPDVGVDVAVFFRYLGSNDVQWIVDAQDSAVWMNTSQMGGVQPYIGDHKNQGFDKIKNVVPQQTCAYVNRGDFTDSYICTAIFNGTNTGYQILDDIGNDVMYQNEGGLLMYTCNSNWTDITITYWQPI